MAGVSSGTIKAIEHGLTDPRLSTLRRLARTFKAHDVEFLFEGPWTGVVISTPSVSNQPKGGQFLCRDEKSAGSSGARTALRQDEATCDPSPNDTTSTRRRQGHRWFRSIEIYLDL